MVSCIAFWFRLTRNEHLFTSGLLVGHGHTNTTSQNNATVSASHAIRIHVCVPSRDGTACCGFDNVRRVDCVHLGYMISTFNASRRSNNIQQPQQSDASTWPTCEWLLPSCQCRKACSPRRSARGPHNMQRGGAKVPSWSTILWLKNVNDSKYAGFYRIIPDCTAIPTFWPNPTPKTFKSQEHRITLIGSWHVILLGKLLQQTPTMAGRTQIIFPKAHQQTHTCLDEPRLAFKRVPLPLGVTYTLLIFLSLSFSLSHGGQWYMNSLLGACSGSYCLNILYCTICLGLLQDNNLQQNHVKFGTCSCTVATFSWCAPEMLNARVSSKYIPRIVQKLKWFNSVVALSISFLIHLEQFLCLLNQPPHFHRFQTKLMLKCYRATLCYSLAWLSDGAVSHCARSGPSFARAGRRMHLQWTDSSGCCDKCVQHQRHQNHLMHSDSLDSP